MDNKTTQKSSEPTLCQKCFSFYGTPNTQNFCSMCFKKIQEEQQINRKLSQEIQLEETQTLKEQLDTQKPLKKIDSSKCNHCDKKIGIRGFQCKCDYFFCKKHRIPENHDCDFDFKTFEKGILSKNNQACMADKVTKF